MSSNDLNYKTLKSSALKLQLLLAVFVLVGCVTEPQSPSSTVVSMPLLAVHDFGVARQLQQRVVGQYGDSNHEMLCVLELRPQHINLVGLSPQGLKLFALQYDGQDMQQSRSRWVPKQLQPTQVLSDIQLALWPAGTIAEQLLDPWRLQWQDGERQLFYRDQLHTEVRYRDGDLLQVEGMFTLTNHYYGYSLQVETVEINAL